MREIKVEERERKNEEVQSVDLCSQSCCVDGPELG